MTQINVKKLAEEFNRKLLSGDLKTSKGSSTRVDTQKPVKTPVRYQDLGSRSYTFTVFGHPMGKPRMTQRDKWKKRPVVLRYRAWKDKIRKELPKDFCNYIKSISIVCFMPIAKSYSENKKELLYGFPYFNKPDSDNIEKGVWDALGVDDKFISENYCRVVFRAKTIPPHCLIQVREYSKEEIEIIKRFVK